MEVARYSGNSDSELVQMLLAAKALFQGVQSSLDDVIRQAHSWNLPTVYDLRMEANGPRFSKCKICVMLRLNLVSTSYVNCLDLARYHIRSVVICLAFLFSIDFPHAFAMLLSNTCMIKTMRSSFTPKCLYCIFASAQASYCASSMLKRYGAIKSLRWYRESVVRQSVRRSSARRNWTQQR